MAHDFDIKCDQRLKIYYSEGLAYESTKDVKAIDSFNMSLNLIGDNK